MGRDNDTCDIPARTCPAVPLALLLLTGILGALLPLTGRMSWWASIPLGFICVFCLAHVFRLHRMSVVLLPLLGFLLAGIHWWGMPNTYADALPRVPGSLYVRGTVVQPAYKGEEIAWLQGMRRYALRVHAVRRPGERNWRSCGGKVLLVTSGSKSLGYGDAIEGRAAVVLPGAARLPDEFDYREYLRCKGIRHEFRLADPPDVIHHAAGWRRLPAALYWCRDRLVERLVRHVPTEVNAQMLAALVFGYREALTNEIRLRFLEGGAIHLFAVSGLHIGIAAGLFLVGMQAVGVQYRWRYWILPLMLGLYVFITGSAASAVRAWLMISVWSVSQARMRAASPLNAVAVAAVILLLLNPMQAFTPGFQFSFLIVTVLLLGWRLAEAARVAVQEKNYWRPYRLRNSYSAKLAAVHPKAISLLAVVVLAWFGSAGLMAGKNAMLVPAGIVVNIFLSFLAWTGLLAAMLKTLLAVLHVPWIDAGIGWGLDHVMSAVRGAVAVGDWFGGSRHVAPPPQWLMISYYAALFATLCPAFRLRWRSAACGGTCVALVLICGLNPPAHDEIFVFRGDGTACPVVAIPGTSGAGPVLINVGGYKRSRHVKAWLRQHGFGRIRLLVLHERGWHAAGGLASILEEYPIETLVTYPQPRARKLEDLPARARANLGRVRVAQDAAETSDLEHWESRGAGCTISFERRNQIRTTTVTIPLEDNLEVKIRTDPSGTGLVSVSGGHRNNSGNLRFWGSMTPRYRLLSK